MWKTGAVFLGVWLLGWASQFEYPMLAASLILLCRVLNMRSLGALALTSFAFSFLTPTVSPALKASAMLGSFLLSYLLFVATRGLSAGHRLVALHAGSFALLLVVDAGALVPPPLGPVVMALSTTTLVSFCWSFYYLCQIAMEGKPVGFLPFCRRTLPPWFETARTAPMIHQAPLESDPHQILTRRCLKLAFGGALLLLIGHGFDALLHGRELGGHLLPGADHPLPDLMVTGLTPHLFGVYSRLQVWGALCWNALRVILRFFAVGVFAECCYCALGYQVIERFHNPLRASSLAELYTCIIPYYVFLLRQYYLNPCYSALRRRGWRREPAYRLAVALAVVGGGLWSHILRDVHLVAGLGPRDFLLRYLMYATPYFVLVLLGLWLVRLPRVWPAAVKFPILLLVYALILAPRMDGLFFDPSERLQFFRLLFSLGG